MGAPLWTADEEEVFEKIIIPMSDYASGDHIKGSGMSWEDLAPIMQDELEKRNINKRTYTGENLFQHHYQRHGKRAKERNQLAAQQPLSKATASGPLARVDFRDTTPLRSSRAGSATPSRLASLRQLDEHTKTEMYYDRSAQTDVSIDPLDDTDGNAEIRGYESTLLFAHPYTSNNHHTVAHSFDSIIPVSNREDMDFELAESRNKSQYQAYVEDDVDNFSDLNMYSKSGENGMRSSSSEYPPKSRSSSNGQYLKAHAAKSSSVSSHRQSSTPHSSGKKKIIAPKRSYGSSPAQYQKRSRHTGPAPSMFGNPAMDQVYQSSSVAAQPLMSQPNNSKPPAMGSFAPHSSSRQGPNKGGLSRAEAMAQVLRNLKREKQSLAHASPSVSAPVQKNLQTSTLHSTVDDPEQDPFGPQIIYGRPESALSNSRTSAQSTTGTLSRRRGKNRLAPLRSPPPLARHKYQATAEAAENMLALGNQYSFQTSPGHSYRTLSPSQQSTPVGLMSTSPLKFATPTKDQRAYPQQHEPSPLQMMSNFSDYDSAKYSRYEGGFAIDNGDSPSAGCGSSGGRGSSGGGSRNNPPVPPFNTGSPPVQSTQDSQPGTENSFMGYDGPAPHTLIPNESIFSKRPAPEDPNDEGQPAPKRQVVAKIQLAYDTGSLSPSPVPATLSSTNTEISYVVQAPPQKPQSVPSDDLLFEPGSPSPPPLAPKKRTSTSSAALEPPKPRKIVPEVALAYDIGDEESKLPAQRPGYIPTGEPITRTTNRRGSRGSRASSARSSVRSPSISSLQVPTKSATPPTSTFKVPSKRSSLASSIDRPEDISRSSTSTPDLNLFATTNLKQKMNSAPAALAKPEQTMTKAEARREAERKASIAHGVAKIQERTGIP